MSEDLARVIAFAYHRRGVDVMERSKLLHLLTFDLRWFSPDPAKRILARAIESGLLATGDEVRMGTARLMYRVDYTTPVSSVS